MESNAYVIRTNTMSWNLKDKKWNNLIKNFIPQILKIEGRVMQADFATSAGLILFSLSQAWISN